MRTFEAVSTRTDQKRRRASFTVRENVKLFLLLSVADKVAMLSTNDKSAWVDEFPKQFRPVVQAYLEGHRPIRDLIGKATVKTVRKTLQEALELLQAKKSQDEGKRFYSMS